MGVRYLRVPGEIFIDVGLFAPVDTLGALLSQSTDEFIKVGPRRLSLVGYCKLTAVVV
jgi:hypothetical protein